MQAVFLIFIGIVTQPITIEGRLLHDDHGDLILIVGAEDANAWDPYWLIFPTREREATAVASCHKEWREKFVAVTGRFGYANGKDHLLVSKIELSPRR